MGATRFTELSLQYLAIVFFFVISYYCWSFTVPNCKLNFIIGVRTQEKQRMWGAVLPEVSGIPWASWNVPLTPWIKGGRCSSSFAAHILAERSFWRTQGKQGSCQPRDNALEPFVFSPLPSTCFLNFNCSSFLFLVLPKAFFLSPQATELKAAPDFTPCGLRTTPPPSVYCFFHGPCRSPGEGTSGHFHVTFWYHSHIRSQYKLVLIV